MPRRFEGQVVIVTGSSNGIGRAIAKLFVQEGAKVTLTGRSPEAMKISLDECVAAGASPDSLHSVLGDLREAELCEKIVTETVNKFGRLDVLVNNAGGTNWSSNSQIAIEMPVENFDYMMALNVRAAILLTQHSIPHLEKTKGAIVNISSVAGFPHVMPLFGYYAVTKAALDQLTVQLGATLISKGIRVNSVNPGVTSTDIIQKTGVVEDKAQEFYNKMGSTEYVPAGRPGTPDDMAKAVLFLADRSQSEYIVGVRLVVDGGCLLRNSMLANFNC